MTGTMDLYDRMAATSKAMVLSHLDAFKAQDTSILSRDLAPTARRRMAPAVFSKKYNAENKSNEEYEKALSHTLGKFQDMSIEINDIMVDVPKRRSTVHSSHVWTVLVEGEMQEWPMEFMWMLELSEDGEKVEGVLEFLDTYSAVAFNETVKKKQVQG